MSNSSMMPTINKRILIFSLAYHPVVGGAEIATNEIVKRISDIDFDVITLRFNKEHNKIEKIENCTIYRIDSSKSLYPVKALLLAIKLHKEKSYNAVWAIMANWAGLAALFFKMRFPKVFYILTLQEGDSLSYIRRKVFFIYPLFKKIFLKANVIQVISNYLGDWARNIGYKGRLEVIPNGVDIDKFTINNKQYSGNKEKIKLITTSRLVEKNAIQDIIEALKFLPENVELEVVGTGPLEHKLKYLSKNLNLESRVKFMGNVQNSDISLFLKQADIFVRPSLSEGQGVSFIEAMAIELPVIATAVGGIPDFLKDRETGLFCEVSNPKRIADRIMEYINNPELKEKIAKNAKRMVEEKYDWNLIVKEMKSKVFQI